MVIIVDTREKPCAIKGIIRHFKDNGIEIVHKKLDIGDYFNPERPDIVIDRKRNLNELASNLGTDRARFYREVRRAHDGNVQLCILCEHGEPIKTQEDILKWENPLIEKHKEAMSGMQLYQQIEKLRRSYGVKFVFCNKMQTGENIIRILKQEDL